ncbi:sushi domain-containing protein 1 [Arapaima gigas]
MWWKTRALRVAVLLLFISMAFTDMLVSGEVLDVCSTCHVNATCEEELDGRKVCNCMYGFVGNGRTHCQDKDECQIGANKICGDHTACHNTYGSFHCTCMSGYRPSNNMTVFIPNDGTYCDDIDECQVQNVCGEGAKCSNIQGSFRCHCQVGYRVQNGSEPFHPGQDMSYCKAIDCGPPPSPRNAILLNALGTHYGSLASFDCMEGFLWKNGSKLAECRAQGIWDGPSLLCQEVDCGEPPSILHAAVLWSPGTRMGAVVQYSCHEGYYNAGTGNASLCTSNGSWDPVNMSCQEVHCGELPSIPHAAVLWSLGTRMGAEVQYSCHEGYYNAGTGNTSRCSSNGSWDPVNMFCQEVDCGEPPSIPHAAVLWSQGTRVGSEVQYHCRDGYYNAGTGNASRCSSKGFWSEVSMVCKALCGPAPMLPHAVVLWQNDSMVVHHCQDGYHHYRGSNVSRCGDSGEWHAATLLCREKKPAIRKLQVYNERCLRWKATIYSGDQAKYKIKFVGSRVYKRSFQHHGGQDFISGATTPELCLNLLPGTNYSISVTVQSPHLSLSVFTSTSIQAPPVPVVVFRDIESPFPTLKLSRVVHTLDPISVYQVFVLALGGTTMFDCSSPDTPDFHDCEEPCHAYVAAQISLADVGKEIHFTVGDLQHYGGYYNAPLQPGRDYYIILRAISQWEGVRKQSCVIWAKVRGMSYMIQSTTLITGGSVGLVGFILFIVHSYTWYCKKTNRKLNGLF